MIAYIVVGCVIGGGIAAIIVAFISAPVSLTTRIISHAASRDVRTVRMPYRVRLAGYAAGVVERLGSTNVSVARRLGVVGHGSVSAFRLSQIQWAGGGIIAGALSGTSLVIRGFPALTVLATVGFGGVCGALWADYRLTTAARATSRILTAQLPDVIELIALAVSAGEPVRPAIERAVRSGSGPLIEHLRTTLAHIHAGKSLPAALSDLSVRAGNQNVSRFTDSLITAMEQGGGLAQTLHNQARDARDAARRDLLEEGGKAEISMMIPVVFLILPITVIFTIFPALSQLTFM
ncbi:type II secretion system F family protein [Arcanobacterium haemolyticum]